MPKNRDLSLDAMKGVICISMAVAHSYSVLSTGSLEFYIHQVAFLTTGIFLSVSGILAYYQSTRDKLSRIIIFYVIVFFLGFSYNCLLAKYFFDFNNISLPPDGMRIFYLNFECEILQLIPLGCITVAAAARIFKDRNYLYLSAAIVLYALYLISSSVMPQFPLKSFIISPGVFPPVPWLVYFFAGVYAFRTRNRNNIIVAAVLFIIYIAMHTANHYSMVWSDRKHMPINYMLLSLIVLFVFNFIFRSIGARIKEKNFFVYLGRNSLLFLYLHIFIISIFLSLKFGTWYIVWPSILILSFFLILVFEYINKKIKIKLYYIPFWIILCLCIWITPIIFRSNLAIILILELIFGIIFSLKISDLSVRIKKGRLKPATA